MEFRGKLFEKYSEYQKYLIPREVYYETIEDLKTMTKVSTSMSRHQYYILKKYEVLKCGDVEKLIRKKKSPEDHPVYYATIEDTYDIISKAHIATGHRGREPLRLLPAMIHHYLLLLMLHHYLQLQLNP